MEKLNLSSDELLLIRTALISAIRHEISFISIDNQNIKKHYIQQIQSYKELKTKIEKTIDKIQNQENK